MEVYAIEVFVVGFPRSRARRSWNQNWKQPCAHGLYSSVREGFGALAWEALQLCVAVAHFGRNVSPLEEYRLVCAFHLLQPVQVENGLGTCFVVVFQEAPFEGSFFPKKSRFLERKGFFFRQRAFARLRLARSTCVNKGGRSDCFAPRDEKEDARDMRRGVSDEITKKTELFQLV